jgi:hypothetical protein
MLIKCLSNQNQTHIKVTTAQCFIFAWSLVKSLGFCSPESSVKNFVVGAVVIVADSNPKGAGFDFWVMLRIFPYVKEGSGHLSDKPTSEKKKICLEILKGKALTLLGCCACICLTVCQINWQNSLTFFHMFASTLLKNMYWLKLDSYMKFNN